MVPMQVIKFVGNLLNIIDMTLGIIPSSKVELMKELNKCPFKSTTNRKQLESLVGKLQFLSNCVRPGHLFMSHLLVEMRNMNRNTYYNISEEARKDIRWWYLFLPGFEGSSDLWLLDVLLIDSDLQ